MSNFVQFVQKQTFYELRYICPSRQTLHCCIYDKCGKNDSLAYIWHLKHNKIHLHIIRLFSSFTVFRKLLLYKSQQSHTHDYTLASLPQYIYTYTITQYILARMRVHTYSVLSHVVSLKYNNFQAYTYRPSNAIYN